MRSVIVKILCRDEIKRTLWLYISFGWDSNFLQGNINNPNMFAKLINKKYKPSKVKKGEILTSKHNPTKLIVVKIAIY